jgi:hypothetical protein
MDAPRRLLALLALGSLSACGGGDEAPRTGGPTVNSRAPSQDRIVCSSSYVVCPSGIPGDATPLASLKAATPYAVATEKDAVFAGYFSGHAIGRDGRPSSVAGSGWNFELCSKTDGHVVDLVISAAGCSGAALCDKAYPCSPGDPPAIDADQAIATAFPDDPAGTLYEVVFRLDYGRAWYVARKSNTKLVRKVDADTGALASP